MSVQDCNRIKPAHNVLWIKFQHVDIELYRNMFIYEYMMVRVKQHKHKRHTLLQTTLKWELPGTGLPFFATLKTNKYLCSAHMLQIRWLFHFDIAANTVRSYGRTLLLLTKRKYILTKSKYGYTKSKKQDPNWGNSEPLGQLITWFWSAGHEINYIGRARWEKEHNIISWAWWSHVFYLKPYNRCK